MDEYVSLAQDHGASVLYTFGGTPQWASARPNEVCPYGLGCAAEPLSMSDWEEYVRQVVRRYRGRVEAYELWNEPKFFANEPVKGRPFFTGSVETMIEMARIARKVINTEDPQAKLVSPGFDGGTRWLGMFLDAGGGSLVDVIGYHFYSSGAQNFAQEVVDVRNLLSAHSADTKPLWNTESGFEAVQDGREAVVPGQQRLSRSEAAGLLAETMVLGAFSPIERFYVYAWDHKTMGMVDIDEQPVPSYWAFRNITGWLNGAVTHGCETGPRNVVLCKGSKGARTFEIAWASSPSSLDLVVPVGKKVMTESALEVAGKPLPADKSASGRAAIQIGAVPTYIELADGVSQ
jgi:hypothetical protein